MEQKMNMTKIETQKKRPFHEDYDDVDDKDCSFFSSSSSSDVSSFESDSDSNEEVTSPTSSSSSTHQLEVEEADPLNNMSSLFQQLPIKRGLSKFYQGKSQSFTSLTNVKSLEDLVKPESPYNKKLKSCKSYGGFYENQDSISKFSFKSTKKGVYSASSRGSCSSLNARKGSGSNFVGSRPPVHPHNRSSTSTNNISNQTALFA
ncbi:hypothetical protein TSUD_123850 [Trifolium subterraneum]|uniref:Oxidative stress 3 n=1 Tax=Trifolium subterraneum TaxID=3900 RepID=A0A2Z6NHU8_TRISU|nr:hypothetical protein TSUD_123850 [Trifolium subterraneum]